MRRQLAVMVMDGTMVQLMSNYSLIKLQVSKQLAARGHRPASHFIPDKPTPMRLPLSSRRDALSLLALSALPALPPTALPAVADMGAVAPGYNPGETAEDLAGALGGLKPGSGRPLNALIKMRSETGIGSDSDRRDKQIRGGTV